MGERTDDEQTRYDIGQDIRRLLRLAPDVHDTLAEHVGVGVTDLLALDHITSAAEPLGVVELATRLNIRSASATVLVDRLVASGHLERSPHPTDRRRIGLQPTPAAHQHVRTALAPLIEGIVRVVDDLDDDEARTVLRFLHDLTTALTTFTDAPVDSTPDLP